MSKFLGRNVPRSTFSWAAVAVVMAVPLSGCMSSGASSFADGISTQDQTASITATQEVPFNVIDNNDSTAGAKTDADKTAPTQLAMAEPPAPRVKRPAINVPATTNQARDLQALAPADINARLEHTDQFASLTPASVTTGDQMRTGYMEPAGYPLDPENAAAQMRIPALYASIDHGQCKGGWGPKPAMINAERMTPGDPYYMEMRLRNTPPLPVGHVYIAYGRLSPDGQPLDEKLIMLAPVGGYGGAAFAAAVPMPGVMKPYGDDCILHPIAAYRVSLSPEKFEQLLLEIKKQKARKPSYALFAYNCNHFMSDVAKSVGVLPPKNIYTASLTYFYDMMDRNEGRHVARTKRELAQQQIALASVSQPPPLQTGSLAQAE